MSFETTLSIIITLLVSVSIFILITPYEGRRHGIRPLFATRESPRDLQTRVRRRVVAAHLPCGHLHRGVTEPGKSGREVLSCTGFREGHPGHVLGLPTRNVCRDRGFRSGLPTRFAVEPPPRRPSDAGHEQHGEDAGPQSRARGATVRGGHVRQST